MNTQTPDVCRMMNTQTPDICKMMNTQTPDVCRMMKTRTPDVWQELMYLVQKKCRTHLAIQKQACTWCGKDTSICSLNTWKLLLCSLRFAACSFACLYCRISRSASAFSVFQRPSRTFIQCMCVSVEQTSSAAPCRGTWREKVLQCCASHSHKQTCVRDVMRRNPQLHDQRQNVPLKYQEANFKKDESFKNKCDESPKSLKPQMPLGRHPESNRGFWHACWTFFAASRVWCRVTFPIPFRCVHTPCSDERKFLQETRSK